MDSFRDSGVSFPDRPGALCEKKYELMHGQQNTTEISALRAEISTRLNLPPNLAESG
jgi:hypothetical protein